MICSIDLSKNYSYVTQTIIDHYNRTFPGYSYHSGKYGETWSWTLGNITVKVNQWGIKVKIPSLGKWFKGNNQETLTIKEEKAAIKKLGKILKLSLFDAKVRRIDFSDCIICKYPVHQYLRALRVSPRQQRKEMPTGLYFLNTTRAIVFYDKNEESRVTKTRVIELFQDKNILRIENRVMKQQTLAQDLKLKEVTMQDVFDNYNVLISNWVESVLKIEKAREVTTFSPEMFKIKGGVLNQLLIEGVQSVGGLSELTEAIKDAKKAGYLKSNDARYMIKKLTAVMANPSLTQRTDIAQEIDDKVRLTGFLNSIEQTEDQILDGDFKG